MLLHGEAHNGVPIWSKNSIRMKSKDDGSRGPGGPDGSVTPRYITKKSPRNVRHGVLETSLTISCVFRKIEFFDYTRSVFVSGLRIIWTVGLSSAGTIVSLDPRPE